MNINRRTTIIHKENTMKLTTAKLIRGAGLAAMAAGILFVVIQILHPADVLASVTTTRWAIVHILGVIMCLCGLFGLIGLYGRQADRAGWLGFVGYLLFSLFYAVTIAFQFVEAFVSPVLARETPRYVQGLLGIVTSHTSEISLGALPTIYAANGVLYMLGALLFGFATIRANVLPRWAGGLLAFSGPLAAIIQLLAPHPFDRLAALPMGLALAWLGYAVVSERRAPVSEPLPGRANSQLSQTGAD